jgi:hypothetical protein
MSTKTTFKRIALVTVAALGFGVLTSVAPASAATPVGTAITATLVEPARVGIQNKIKVTVTIPAATANTVNLDVSATAAVKPTGSSQNGMLDFLAGSSADDNATGTTKGATERANSVASTATVAANGQIDALGDVGLLLSKAVNF